MEIIGLILVSVCAIASLACWVMVLIAMFKNESPLHGIIGIFCGLYAFIWGWMKASNYGLKKIMLIWTVVIILTLIFNFTIAGASIMSQM